MLYPQNSMIHLLEFHGPFPRVLIYSRTACPIAIGPGLLSPLHGCFGLLGEVWELLRVDLSQTL